MDSFTGYQPPTSSTKRGVFLNEALCHFVYDEHDTDAGDSFEDDRDAVETASSSTSPLQVPTPDERLRSKLGEGDNLDYGLDGGWGAAPAMIQTPFLRSAPHLAGATNPSYHGEFGGTDPDDAVGGGSRRGSLEDLGALGQPAFITALSWAPDAAQLCDRAGQAAEDAGYTGRLSRLVDGARAAERHLQVDLMSWMAQLEDVQMKRTLRMYSMLQRCAPFRQRLAARNIAPEAVSWMLPRGSDCLPTSVGSLDHASGTCRPCAFVYGSVGCGDDMLCEFCHLPHDNMPKFKFRPGKGKRDRYKKFLTRLAERIEEDPQGFDDAACAGAVSEFVVNNPQFEKKVESDVRTLRQILQTRPSHEIDFSLPLSGEPGAQWPRQGGKRWQ